MALPERVLSNGFDESADANETVTLSRLGRDDSDKVQREVDPAVNRPHYFFQVPCEPAFHLSVEIGRKRTRRRSQAHWNLTGGCLLERARYMTVVVGIARPTGPLVTVKFPRNIAVWPGMRPHKTDTGGLKSAGRKAVGVQVPLWAPFKMIELDHYTYQLVWRGF